MADVNTEDKLFTIFVGAIELLCQAVTQMEALIEKPEFLDADTADKRFRFKSPDLLVFQVLMCVRIASGLRAASILLAQNHAIEVAVLFRTIDDFIADVDFADEVIERGGEAVTVSQKEFLDKYFLIDERSIEQRLESPAKVSRPRQKIQAAEARMLGGENPDRIKKIARAVDDVFSGYVHGNYSSVMEMYGGTAYDAHFHTRGIGFRFSVYRHHLGIYVHRALNTFFKVAHNLGHEELARHIIEFRRYFENSPAYTTE